MKRWPFLFVLLFSLSCQPTEKKENTIVLSSLAFTELNGEPVQWETDTFTLVNFWATWCRPCVEEIPSLDALQAKSHDWPLHVILVSNESTDKIDRFLNKRKEALHFVQSETGLRELGIRALPTTFLFGPDGELLERFVGARDWASPSSLKEIQSLMGKTGQHD